MAPSLKSLLSSVVAYLENELDMPAKWINNINSKEPYAEFKYHKENLDVLLILRISKADKKTESSGKFMVQAVFNHFKEDEIFMQNIYKKDDLNLDAYKIFNQTKVMIKKGFDYKNVKKEIAETAAKYSLIIDEKNSWSAQTFILVDKNSRFQVGKILTYDAKYKYMATKGHGWMYRGDDLGEAIRSLIDPDAIRYHDDD